MPDIIRVAVPTPLRKTFDYLVPASHQASDLTGYRVEISFSHQTLVGVVLGHVDESDVPLQKLKAASSVIDDYPLLSHDVLSLCKWVADYYQHPIGEVVASVLPTQLRKLSEIPTPKEVVHWQGTSTLAGQSTLPVKGKKQLMLVDWLRTNKVITPEQCKALGVTPATLKSLHEKNLVEPIAPDQKHQHTLLLEKPLTLNEQQSSALKAIRFHEYATYLLDGQTGSGKTEVYLHAITRTLQTGKQVLVLVPEIGLTPQTLARFEQRFNVPIVQLHSQVAQGQRTQNWIAAATGNARIIIGTRLAIFTPVPELGMIILDEEHDLSFKQQDGLRYSARDVAVMRAHRNNIPLILGSATPALESLYNAQAQRYQHLLLQQRAGTAKPPTLHCVDMRKEPPGSTLSATATATVASALQRGEQVLVFINRRGFAPALLCHCCGWTAVCRACDAKMTVHQYPPHLHCHHCDQQMRLPHQCPSCLNTDLDTRGHGTERCELLLQKMFPEVDVVRVDQDSMQRQGAMKSLYERMEQNTPCILVGTQMLAKGHHFPRVTTVVLLDIDQGLFSGDFRGPERMGQQIIQVAGRAGRADLPGVVLLQTYQPDHPLLQCLLQQGYHAFANELLHERAICQLPPNSYMALIRAESKRAENAKAFLALAASTAKQIRPPSPNHKYLGPIPALMEKRNDRFRFQLQITFSNRKDLQHLLFQLITNIQGSALASRTRWSVDVDPQDMS